MTAPQTHKVMRQFAYARSPDQDAARIARHPVVVVGAGPVGLSTAIDLAQRGIRVVLLDDADRIGEGSRGLCYAKRTLEIFGRLGCAAPMLEKGVEWRIGKVFQGEDLLYRFDLLPEGGHRMPAFINLQQYYLEAFLVDRALQLPLIDLRWKNKVTALFPQRDGARLTIATPDGPYQLDADWMIACDGARSETRRMLGLEFVGETFEDQFLIADVKMRADFPTERWFWFDPPFHSGQSALLHRQPDDIWRIDLQLGAEADTEAEKQPEKVIPRIRQMLGHDAFDLEWVSVYRFQCRRLAKFRHGRVIFAGDSAHQVSPFGARGANSGVQDAENLAWKLALHLQEKAPEGLIDSYEAERGFAADENIRHSTRSTDFIAPHSAAERRLRNAALTLANRTGFARRMVNSGRLSVATDYTDSSLNTADSDIWTVGPPPGAAISDAPLADAYGTPLYLSEVLPKGFALLGGAASLPADLPDGVTPVAIGTGSGLRDPKGLLAERFDLAGGGAYLIRPDMHVAARFRNPTGDTVTRAHEKAIGKV